MSFPASPHASPTGPPAVRFSNVAKGFHGVHVLKGVSFDVHARRILGLVGENGAGKSTLMNLLGGHLALDSGALEVEGRLYSPRSPADARAAGIAFVHQELNLFGNLSIAENLFLDAFPAEATGNRCSRFWIRRRVLEQRAVELLRQVGLHQDPETRVEQLSAGERQLVEIAKALGTSARILMLDEPTTSLSLPECDRLFALLGRLRDRGLAVIYISHALDDVRRLVDELVVLRDGAVVGQGPVASFTPARLIHLMVGREQNQVFPSRARWATADPATLAPVPGAADGASGPPPRLEVCAVSQPGVTRNVSFQIAPGEILGLAGLLGAGRSELARILFGLDPHRTGEIRLDGQPLTGSPRERIRRGLAFLTEDRRAEGLCLDASLADNLALVTLDQHRRRPFGWVHTESIRQAVRRMREAVRLTPTARDSQPVRTLSGGNQQKVVLGKWLLAKPRVLILDEPTRGIDVGAKFEIYQLIQQLADDGAGVLVISSELEELTGLCDRILVLRKGEITADLARARFHREELLAAALPPVTA